MVGAREPSSEDLDELQRLMEIRSNESSSILRNTQSNTPPLLLSSGIQSPLTTSNSSRNAGLDLHLNQLSKKSIFVTPPPSPSSRLIPRSAQATSSPRKDLALLKEALEAGPENGNENIKSPVDNESRSESPRMSSPSPRNSSRAEALRRDIENTALRLKEGKAGAQGIANLTAVNLSSLSLQPATGSSAEGSASSIGSRPLQNPFQGSTKSGMSARGPSGRERRTESREWNQGCWIWANEKEKNRLVKPKKRESGNGLFFDMLQDDEGPDGLPPLPDGSAPEIIGPYHGSKGHWNRVQAIITGNGCLKLFDQESILLVSINLASTDQSNVRVVDEKLFGRKEILCIDRKANVAPTAPTSQHFFFASPFEKIQPYDSPPRGSGFRGDDSIYLCFQSLEVLGSFMVLMQCFTRPAILAEDNNYDEMEDEDELLQCRIHRSLLMTVNEGRGIGENQTLTMESNSNSLHLAQSNKLSFSESITSSLPIPAPTIKKPSSTTRDRERVESFSGNSQSTFIEVVFQGDVIARSTSRKTTTNSPMYRESYKFEGLPQSDSISIRVYENHKVSRAPTLIGSTSIRLNDLEKIDGWFPVRPVGFEYQGFNKKSVGELSIAASVTEQIVLSSIEYQRLLLMLRADDDATLALNLAATFTNSLDSISSSLLPIYIIESRLLPRIYSFLKHEISQSTTESSQALLFRGNSITAKIIESYFRMIGTDFLEASIGNVVRQIIKEKISIELDPARFKGKEKVSTAVREMTKWLSLIWNGIYDHREFCPKDFRLIFQKIQSLVMENLNSNPAMRSISVGAFLILRYIVPALLRPFSFNLCSSPPSQEVCRTLTLLGKTLQGLANHTIFGRKEEWMSGMNEWVTDTKEAYIDYIDFVSKPLASARFDWTSIHASSYLQPNRLRSTLPVKDHVPQLPHLIDINLELARIASIIGTATNTTNSTNSPRLIEFIEEATKVDARARIRAESANRISKESIDPLVSSSISSNTWPRKSPARPTFERIYQSPKAAESVDQITKKNREYKTESQEDNEFESYQYEPDPSHPFLSKPSSSRRPTTSPNLSSHHKSESPSMSTQSSFQSNNSFYGNLKRTVSSSSKATSIKSTHSITSSTLESVPSSPKISRPRPSTITTLNFASDLKELERLKDIKTKGEGNSGKVFTRFLPTKDS